MGQAFLSHPCSQPANGKQTLALCSQESCHYYPVSLLYSTVGTTNGAANCGEQPPPFVVPPIKRSPARRAGSVVSSIHGNGHASFPERVGGKRYSRPGGL